MKMADKIIIFLEGTPMNLSDAFQQLDIEETAEIVEQVESEIFECCSCGWWCWLHEQSEGALGTMCESCVEEEEMEEEEQWWEEEGE